MKGHILRTLAVCILVALFSSVASAQVAVVETCTDTLGATIITWDSELEDLNYTMGDPITMTVTWTVDAGMATYNDAVLRHYTPKSKKDPAVGDEPTFTYPGSAGDNSVDIMFSFTELHLDEDNAVEIGNGHFTFLLDVDEDGDGEVDAVARFGTNIHVEDPQETVE
ncbi:MAG: hypothetical protein JSV03_05945 [Planctomycetota bacterium]|nr:MAG: hypothetical protein JSV03_05945 [Planctomycetota bacterium]